jgi:small nuclear ribonucleoprotein (snRNP)-like protein
MIINEMGDLMAILQKHLGDVVGKEIVLVMSDGQAFKGKLSAFDDENIMLTDVMESRAADARWREALVTVPTTGFEGGGGRGIMIGDSGTSMLKLTTVILRIRHVSRIWLWKPETPEGF